MKLATVAAIAAVSLTAAGCGSTAATNSTAPAPTPAPTATVAATTGFHDMSTLQDAIQQKIQQNMDKDPADFAGVTVTGGICVSTSDQAAQCNTTLSVGPEITDQVTIAADGLSFVAH